LIKNKANKGGKVVLKYRQQDNLGGKPDLLWLICIIKGHKKPLSGQTQGPAPTIVDKGAVRANRPHHLVFGRWCHDLTKPGT